MPNLNWDRLHSDYSSASLSFFYHVCTLNPQYGHFFSFSFFVKHKSSEQTGHSNALPYCFRRTSSPIFPILFSQQFSFFYFCALSSASSMVLARWFSTIIFITSSSLYFQTHNLPDSTGNEQTLYICKGNLKTYYGIYNLVVDWNRPYIRTILKAKTKSFLDWPDQLKTAILISNERAQQIINQIYPPDSSMRNEWKRNLGIDIACEDEDNANLPNPIKKFKVLTVVNTQLYSQANQMNGKGCDSIRGRHNYRSSNTK